ncbi:lipopolysaccharide assembly protein LapB [uncultured Gilvimarinus sp.]|uniref:lipopolysaccharide assembly protein LapB n=1 Tax=uncultured Gilvimarinus sp. TaxID=1689143 RepID=UPI0030EE893B|tara:strand:- start:157 stop:1344 length:1188 start_codon:yes stop_codon:yes gene_type:complete
MADLLMYGLLLLALAIGFALGRWHPRRKSAQYPKDYALNYYKGLSYLFNEQPDSAIDAFIGSLAVNSDTLETHLALGNMLRRRGEVTKAIKIHQNLLARPGLNVRQQHESQLELARDYIKAGLLDRAEALLLELVKLSSMYKLQALEHLIEIYQDENEWDNAIAMASQLERRAKQSDQGQGLEQMQAHFACEQALQDLESRHTTKARVHLQEALRFDPSSARASILFARLEFSLGRYREAIKHIHRIPAQDPEYLVEVLDTLIESYERLGESRTLDNYLQQLLREHPSNTLIIKIADRLRWSQDDYVAADFIAEQLKRTPSIRTLNRLVELHLPHSEGKAKENLELLKQLVDQVIAEKPSYCCNKCGFTGNSLHWLCPGCKSWGSIRPIRGVAGE